MSVGSGRRSWWMFAVVVAVGVVPLLGLSYLVEHRAASSVRGEVNDRLSGNAALTALFLDEQVWGVESVISAYARRQGLVNALTRPEGPDVAELDRNMRELLDARSDVLNVVGIADLDGTMITGIPAPPPGASFSDRSWHQTVLRTGRAFVSEAIVGRSPGEPLAIAIGVPVADDDGDLVAIIVAGYPLESLQQFVDTFEAARDTDLTVTDHTGVVIAQPGDPPTALVSRADDPTVERALAGESGVVEDATNAAGQPVLSAYAQAPRLGWTVTAELSRSEAYAQVDALQDQVILITIPLAGLFLLGGVLLARSVRARDAAEREQRRVSEQFARVIEVSPVPTAISRVADGTILLANAAMPRTLGWGSEEVVGRTAADLELWADPERRAFNLERLTREGPIAQSQERLRRRDGSVIDAIVSAESIDFDGEECVLWIFYDISARVAAERAIRAYRSIFEHIHDGVLISSPTGEVQSANSAACEILRMSEDEIRRRGRSGLADPTDERWRSSEHERAAMTQFRGERRMVRGDGSTFVADVSAATFDDESGRSVAAVLFRDVSDRAALLEERALAAAAAEQASRLKSEFLATMSHEIRTPMNGVIGMTGLLLDTELTAEQRDYAETVRASAETLLAILNDILDFSKIEAGRLELEEVDIDVAAVGEEAAELLAAAAHDKGLELVVRIAPDLRGLFRGDPGRVRQVLMNLLGNAIKFTDRGVVELDVSVDAVTDAEAVARFEVSDTGIGIAPETQAHLFQSFMQADAATTRRFGGTGLGLAISKRLVELMGGDIGVTSVLGEGSTFWFSVPLRRSTAPSPPRPKTLVGLRALVVDDIAINRQVLVAQLEVWGIATTAVSSGEAAMIALANASDADERFDIVIADFQMPGMDGVELADEIARHVPSPPPVVVLSSAGGRDSTQGRSTENVARFLVKPARRSRLFDAISTALGESPSRQTTPRPVATARRGVTGGRVLVVDDNAVNQRLAVLLLQRAGYRVDAAGDGAEAVQAVRRRAYAAVLMDCEMPVMDGYEAAAEIRRHEAGRGRVPIIAVTASAMSSDVDRAMAAGMDAHVAKPIDRDELTAVLDELIIHHGHPPPTAGAAVGVLLDPSALDQLRDLDEDGDGFRSLAAIFIRNGPRRLEQLAESARHGDAPGVAAAAHSLRGSAATFGAGELAELAERLEHDARAGRTPPPDIVEQVERLFESVVGALTQEIDEQQLE